MTEKSVYAVSLRDPKPGDNIEAWLLETGSLTHPAIENGEFLW